MNNELELWNETREIMKNNIGDERITLGSYNSFIIKNTPRRLLFTLSYYKFAAKLLGEGKDVLSVGCNEGLGTILLAEFSKKVIGIDIDKEAIGIANKNYKTEKLEFRCEDFLKTKIDEFDGLVSFDLIEHIYPENEHMFFNAINNNLKDKGVCIIGTPNETSNIYSTVMNQKAHVNLYSAERLKNSMSKYFEQVFLFSANDEMVHTGFYKMANYLIAVGINKITKK